MGRGPGDVQKTHAAASQVSAPGESLRLTYLHEALNLLVALQLLFVEADSFGLMAAENAVPLLHFFTHSARKLAQTKKKTNKKTRSAIHTFAMYCIFILCYLISKKVL